MLLCLSGNALTPHDNVFSQKSGCKYVFKPQQHFSKTKTNVLTICPLVCVKLDKPDCLVTGNFFPSGVCYSEANPVSIFFQEICQFVPRNENTYKAYNFGGGKRKRERDISRDLYSGAPGAQRAAKRSPILL